MKSIHRQIICAGPGFSFLFFFCAETQSKVGPLGVTGDRTGPPSSLLPLNTAASLCTARGDAARATFTYRTAPLPGAPTILIGEARQPITIERRRGLSRPEAK